MTARSTLVLAALGTLATVVLASRLAPLAVVALAALNVASLLAFAYDKSAARTGGPRVAEVVLHALGFLGVAGATLGRLLFKHKTLHPAFGALQLLACVATFAVSSLG